MRRAAPVRTTTVVVPGNPPALSPAALRVLLRILRKAGAQREPAVPQRRAS